MRTLRLRSADSFLTCCCAVVFGLQKEMFYYFSTLSPGSLFNHFSYMGAGSKYFLRSIQSLPH